VGTDLETQFKAAMANLAAPVSVITTGAGDEPFATTVSAIASLSLEPPRVLFALGNKSGMLSKLRETKMCGVNLLNADQQGTALACARSGPGKLDGVSWELSGGLPRISRALVWMRCTVVDTISSGDHHIVIAEPDVIKVDEALEPCVYFRRTFCTAADHGGLATDFLVGFF